MTSFLTQINKLFTEIDTLKKDPALTDKSRMANGTFVLPENHILCEPRSNGDSRYPYGKDGFNFWAYASGYSHANEGLFSLFLRAKEGQEPNVCFFAGLAQPENAKNPFLPVPLMPVPVFDQDEELGIQRYSVLSPQAAYYLTRFDGLDCGLRVFVGEDKTVNLSLFAHNTGEKMQRAFFSSYFNPYLRQQLFETDEDRWFKEIKSGTPAVMGNPFCSFIVKVNEDKDRFTSTSNIGVLRRQYQALDGCRVVGHQATTSRYQYVGGTRGSLHSPEALYQGSFGEHPKKQTTFTENAIVGTLLHVELDPDAYLRIDITLNLVEDESQADELSKKILDAVAIDEQLEALKQDDGKRHNALSVHIADSAPQHGVQSNVLQGFF